MMNPFYVTDDRSGHLSYTQLDHYTQQYKLQLTRSSTSTLAQQIYLFLTDAYLFSALSIASSLQLPEQ